MSDCVHPTRLWSLIAVQDALHRDSELDKALQKYKGLIKG